MSVDKKPWARTLQLVFVIATSPISLIISKNIYVVWVYVDNLKKKKN